MHACSIFLNFLQIDVRQDDFIKIDENGQDMDELDAESRETLMKANLDLLVAMLVLALGFLHVKFPMKQR